jgi:hypothetical protein
MVYGLHDTDTCIKPLQRMLNEIFKLELKVDGNIGRITQDAIAMYQASVGISETNEDGACYGERTQASAKGFIESKYIQESDYVNASNVLDVEVAAIKAFAMTEAKEFGFLNCGFPVILFERHIFYREVKKRLGEAKADDISAIAPDICNTATGAYIGGKAEMNRLKKAITFDHDAAISSASWGMMQVMGFNYAVCGYDDVNTFVEEMKQSERNHLKAFVGFIKSNKTLHKALMVKDWETVARCYNGVNYAKNSYHLKMAENYKKALS